MLKKIVVLILILLAFFLIICLKKTNFETNLIKTLLPVTIENSNDIIDITNKTSSIIKVIFDGNSNKQIFLDNIDTNIFEPLENDISKYIDFYKKNTNFLSEKDRILIKNKDYNTLYKNAIKELYNPISIQIVPFDKDPYFLTSNFLLSYKREKNSNIIEYKIKKDMGLSPDKINKHIEKLVKLAESTNVHLIGVPIHSYYTSKNAIISINIISILSILLIFFLIYYYFKDIKLIIPVCLSIGFGILSGFCTVKLFFDNFQVITLVFSTAIIGLGIDYSYHYFFDKEHNKTFQKNLFFSMITTIVPFLVLYLTGIELLKQIAIFCIFALIAIFYFIINFYPYFQKPSTYRNVKFNKKIYKIILSVFCLTSIFGFFNFNFNDSLSAFYTPSKKLLETEKLNTNKTQIIMVNGDDMQNILEKEEMITKKFDNENIDYISLSKYFPSKKVQKENINLIKDLYKNNLYKFKGILSEKQINQLKLQEFEVVEAPKIKEFLLNENTSLIYIFSSDNIVLNEKDAKIINLQSDIQKYLKEYRINLLKLLPIMIFVVFCLLLNFYGVQKSIKIILPSIFGMLGSIGLTSLIMSELNLFSIISLYLVLGFTIDYAIFRAENNKNSENAVFISALTSAFSFLLLSFTSFKLLNSISFILFFGILLSYLYGYIIQNKNEKNVEKV